MQYKRAFSPQFRILGILALLALVGCSTASTFDAPSPSPSPVAATPTIPTSTPAPTATATPLPTQTPVAGIPAFTDPDIQTEIDRLASSLLSSGMSSGLGVAVVLRDRPTGQLRAMLLDYGSTAKDQGQPVTPDTVYEIGSITKVFTGILLAQAVNSGAVHFDDPLQQFMPTGIQAPTYRGQQITLAELATHHSSLPRDANTDSIPDLYAWLDQYQLSQPPGSEYVYSNLGYSLLGDILARLGGTDFGTLEFQQVSQPLGLLDTRESLTSDETSRLAQGYSYDGSPASDFPQSGAMSGAGYLRSTLSDMTRFLVQNMQPDSTPLAADLRLAQQSQAEGRNPGTGAGLGWDLQPLGRPGEIISKGGATSGFTSYVAFRSDGSFGFVLLSNGQYVDRLVPHLQQILDGR